MDAEDFEGSIILENLATYGLVDEFLDAIDSDDVTRALHLMREAEIDEESIQSVLKMLSDQET